MGQLQGKCLPIYDNYKPKNTHEMREYILYTIEKSLMKKRKRGEISDEVWNLLGQIG